MDLPFQSLTPSLSFQWHANQVGEFAFSSSPASLSPSAARAWRWEEGWILSTDEPNCSCLCLNTHRDPSRTKHHSGSGASPPPGLLETLSSICITSLTGILLSQFSENPNPMSNYLSALRNNMSSCLARTPRTSIHWPPSCSLILVPQLSCGIGSWFQFITGEGGVSLLHYCNSSWRKPGFTSLTTVWLWFPLIRPGPSTQPIASISDLASSFYLPQLNCNSQMLPAPFGHTTRGSMLPVFCEHYLPFSPHTPPPNWTCRHGVVVQEYCLVLPLLSSLLCFVFC